MSIDLPLFSSDTVISFVSNLLELEHTVEKMTLEGLGVREETIAAHRQTLTHSLRLSHYGVPEESKMGVTLPRHTDPSFMTSIVQCSMRWKASRCRCNDPRKDGQSA